MRKRFTSSSSERVRPLGALLLLGVTLVLVLAHGLFPQAAADVRAKITDLFAPVLQVFSKPAELLQGVSGNVNDLAHLREENQTLKQEVETLKGWGTVARQFEDENRKLKEMLHYRDESVLSFLTAKVIGENSGSFSNSVIVTAGARDGVEKDMVALDANGVIGRVIEVGEWSARILLLSDLNFRLPVMVEEGRQRAIFAGQSRDAPKLLYISQIAEVKAGMRVTTSGHGGIFPPGLPVGVVREVKDKEHEALVNIYGRLDRLEIVRLARYKLAPPEAEAAPDAQAPAQTPPQPKPAP